MKMLVLREAAQDIPGKGVKRQLQNLSSVYTFYLLHKYLGDFLSTGSITPKQGALANDQLRSLYSQVRPNAVALVNAFNYTDHYLGSVLRRYDGNVYPTLYEEAWKDPLNDPVIPDGYQEYVRPLLKQQLRKREALKGQVQLGSFITCMVGVKDNRPMNRSLSCYVF